MSRIGFAKVLIRLFPRAWRRRYEDEVLDTMSRSPIRLADLADLLRSAADEWEWHLGRSPVGIATLVGVGYLALGSVWLATGFAGNLLALFLGQRGLGPDFGFVAVVPSIAIVFLLPMYTTGLVLNLPLLITLRPARHRFPLGACRCVAAVGMACWGEWLLFRMEWFDVWRHGVPGLRYWITMLLPWGIAWAAAGAVIGGCLPRIQPGDAALESRVN